jgi:hypothetical protein
MLAIPLHRGTSVDITKGFSSVLKAQVGPEAAGAVMADITVVFQNLI